MPIPRTRPKTPIEQFRISMDFTLDLVAGDTLNSHTVTAKALLTGADASGTFLGTVTRTGNVIEVVVRNGTEGDYEVKFVVTTTQGETLEGRIIVPVRDNP